MAHGNRYEVELDDGSLFDCVLRGRHRLSTEAVTNPIAVGDRVGVSSEGAATAPGEKRQGAIEEIHERRTRISRTAPGELPREQVLAANVDAVAAVFSYRQPRADALMVQRLLLAAETGGAEPALVLNKTDLARRKDRLVADALAELVQDAGYRVLKTSAETGAGVPELAAWLSGKICAFVGPSGAGKSSLANAMAPGLNLRVGAVSKRSGRGRHTTTWGALILLPGDIRLVDTPGIGVLDVWGVEPEDLIQWFPDLLPFFGNCQWRNCGHREDEVGCALAAAVETGEARGERLDFFRDIYADLEERRILWEERGDEGGRPEGGEDWEQRWVVEDS